MFSMKIIKISLATLALSVFFCQQPYAEDIGATARGMFAMLPSSIFDNTQEGLPDSDKQDLLLDGKSEFWEITEETPDIMLFSTRPFHDRTIGLKVFRNDEDGSAEVAIGTLGEAVCSLELWRMDISGRIVPVDAPLEPEIKEFFSSSRKRNPGAGHSVMICLDKRGLVANPIFWTRKGMIPAQVDNEISYIWTGKNFKKQISPK